MKARAAVLAGERRFELCELDVPAVPEPGGAILAVEGNGICGSDYEQYRGAMAASGLASFPTVPGHEIVGRVHAVSEEAAADGLTVGDRVAVSSIVACRRCPSCLAGRPKFCRRRFVYGFTPTEVRPGLWGGYGEYVCLRPGTTLHPVEERLSVEDAVLFNPLGAAFEWVARAAGVGVGDSVLVVGAGQRGLACAIAAAESGAARVILAGRGRSAWKLELGRELGATETIDLDRVSLAAAVSELSDGEGVDCAIDTTPLAPEPLLEAIAAVREEGTVVAVGLKDGPVEGFDPDALSMRAVTLRGVFGGSEWGERQALRVLAAGRWPLERLHTHSVGLDDVERAVRAVGGELADEPVLHVSVRP